MARCTSPTAATIASRSFGLEYRLSVILSLRRIRDSDAGNDKRILRRASSYENGLRAWRTGRGSGGKSGCFGVGGFEMHGVTEALEAANGAADDVLPVAFVKV